MSDLMLTVTDYGQVHSGIVALLEALRRAAARQWES